MVARKGENITHIKSHPFSFHSFQDLFYCAFINKVPEGLP
jgi:hypothetical protein